MTMFRKHHWLRGLETCTSASAVLLLGCGSWGAGLASDEPGYSSAKQVYVCRLLSYLAFRHIEESALRNYKEQTLLLF